MQNVKKHFLILLLMVVFSNLTIISCSDDKSENTTKSSEKKILSFLLEQYVPAISGTIDENLKTITATIPEDGDITTVTPTVTISAKATVTPKSGTSVDFTNPVTYVVTAEDGSQATYTVTISVNGSSVTSPEELSGSMSENTVLKDRWDGIDYVITDMFYIEGNALLTIEPGVKIAFANVNSGIEVGENAGLKMVGTAEKPIILTGPVNNDNKGSWYGVEIRSARSDNQFEYVQFINGGSNYDFAVVNIETDASLSIKNCIVDGSLGYGIATYGTASKFTGFANNTVKNCGNSPIYIEDLSHAGVFDSTNTFAGNGKSYIMVMNANISENLEIKNASIPYYIAQYFIYANKTLTLDKGVTLYFNAELGIDIAESTGKLIVNGTDTEPVVFTRLPGETYYWSGIYVRSDIGNEINYAIFEYAGNIDDEGIFWLSSEGAVTLNNVALTHSKNYCVAMSDSSSVDATDVSFSDCASGNIYNYDTEEVSESF